MPKQYTQHSKHLFSPTTDIGGKVIRKQCLSSLCLIYFYFGYKKYVDPKLIYDASEFVGKLDQLIAV